MKEKKQKEIAEIAKEKASCADEQCPFHGKLSVRGRVFEGKVRKKFPRRIVIEFERIVPVKKYERFEKKKTKLHARVPDCMQNVEVGDYVQIRECRPLSKIIHFALIKIVRKAK